MFKSFEQRLCDEWAVMMIIAADVHGAIALPRRRG